MANSFHLKATILPQCDNCERGDMILKRRKEKESIRAEKDETSVTLLGSFRGMQRHMGR